MTCQWCGKEVDKYDVVDVEIWVGRGTWERLERLPVQWRLCRDCNDVMTCERLADRATKR